MIKCPECGHAVSDKAPVCPACGIEIAGHIIVCPQCGNVYLKNEPECPKCHHLTTRVTIQEESNPTTSTSSSAAAPTTSTTAASTTSSTNDCQTNNEQEPNTSSKNKMRIVLISLIVAVVAVAICYAFYSNAQSNKETEAYEYAMSSNDPMVLQSYLDTYKGAPEEHIDSIQAHLALIKQMDQDWTNAVVAGTKSALQQYLEQHPDSPFKALAMHKIDSIDWATAKAEGSVEAMEAYIETHPTGEYINEANEAVKGLNAQTVQPEEKQAINGTFRNFFNALNSKDEDLLTSTVSPLMTSFLNKPDATRSDVVTFMQKLYKPTVATMTWMSMADYKISKKEIGDAQFEYTVDFTAAQVVKGTDGTETKNMYVIKAKINPDCLISELSMKKVVEK